MNKLLRYLKQHTWLMVLPLLLATAYGVTAQAAPTASFSATASGATTNLSLSVTVNIADADVGKNGNYYLGFTYNQLLYFNNGTGWVEYSSGVVPAYASGPLVSGSAEVVSNADLSSLVGAQLHVGYGLTESDMTANGKYAMVYTVPADTAAPVVSETAIADGATGVATNTTVVATFSEAMNPATMTTTTVTLLQGATPVLGTVSYSGLNVVFTPSNPLASNTAYTATIKGGASGVKNLAGNALASDYVWNWTTGATADSSAPTVSSTAPQGSATGVARNTLVTARFSEAMDPLTITTATVTLACPEGTAVTGTVGYALSGSVATFTPASDLPASTTCTATITTGVKDVAGNPLASAFIWAFTTAASVPLGPSAVNLGTAGNFAILAKTAVSTVPPSAITGDVGVSPAATSYLTGFSLTWVGTTSATSTQVTGSLFGADMTVPTSSNLTTAVLDMEAAYTDAAGRPTPDFLDLGSGTIGGLTLVPGLYNWGSSVTIPADITLSGGANDVWIFQMSGDLMMSASKRITLAGGAQAKNIFWQVAGEAIIGTGAHFEGNLLSQTAITLETGATMNGRALAQSQVALQSATVTKPAP